jgi:hypothetical protein
MSMGDLMFKKGKPSIIYKGEMIKKEDTYLKKQVNSGDNFILIKG